MPWLEVSVMELREEFVGLALAPGANVSDLCRRFGIDRSTGHKWLDRYKAEGSGGLADRSRRPYGSPSRQRGGIVVNHVGDALIAAFNAPLPVEDHASRAVDAARALQALVSGRDFQGHRLRLRVGVATGPVAAGTVGGITRQTYTVYGDTVNVAQRLERMNKELGTDSLICGTTFEAARSACVDAVAVGSVQVRGREGALEVFAFGSLRR